MVTDHSSDNSSPLPKLNLSNFPLSIIVACKIDLDFELSILSYVKVVSLLAVIVLEGTAGYMDFFPALAIGG